MPSKRRRQIMDKVRVGAYHCYTRCVRRAFLAGVDWVTGKDRSYRKEWVRKRLEDLASVFMIDVLDHAVMENHVHTILRNRPDLGKKLRRREVVERWLRLSRKKLELNRRPTEKEVDEVLADKNRVRELRRRLSDISWFMIMLNEPIALKANIEDKMSGHFWAERFASERLPNEESLLLCSLYVDLNPIRAGQAKTPEESTYTGACDRLRDMQAERREEERRKEIALRRVLGEVEETIEMDGLRGGAGKLAAVALTGRARSGWMSPLREEGDGYAGAEARRRASDTGYLPMGLEKYLMLLEECGRQEVEGKRGVIPETCPPMLERLGLDPTRWAEEAQEMARRFARIAAKCARQAGERSPRRKK